MAPSGCSSIYTAIGIGLSTGVIAGNYVYCCCTTGPCTTVSVASAELFIEAATPSPAWPSALAIQQQPTLATFERPISPAPVVSLVGALSPGALYRCGRSAPRWVPHSVRNDAASWQKSGPAQACSPPPAPPS
jgi:hypothetical protein